MVPRLSADVVSRVIDQAFKFWIEPEIQRRQAAGKLPKPATIWAAQLLLTPDDTPRVLLNAELRGIFAARPAEGHSLPQPGGTALLSSIGEFLGVELTAGEPNAGHLTIIFQPTTQFLAFDFRYNAARIAALLNRASEFLAAARAAHRRGHSSAFVENAFAATELLATCILLQLPGKSLLSKPSHGHVQRQFNWFGRLNVPQQFVKLLNRLTGIRATARYRLSTYYLSADERRTLLRVASAFRRHVDQRRPRRRNV